VGAAQGELFADADPPAGADRAVLAEGDRVVSVLPDVRNLRQPFDYLVPADMAGDIAVGTLVDIELGGRRLRGWVVGVDVPAPPGVVLRSIRRVRSIGPDPGVTDLTAWGAWRFAGARTALLATASAPVRVTTPGPPHRPVATPDAAAHDAAGARLSRHYEAPLDTVTTDPVTVVRLAPATDPFELVATIAGLGPLVVVTPTQRQASEMVRRLGSGGHRAVGLPSGWAAARSGATSVVGTRVAAWGPCPNPAAVVVIDEHDEAHFQQHTPTWHARTVALERARRAGVPCLLVSPTPSLEALDAGRVVTPSRAVERAGWPVVDVADQRLGDPLLPAIISDKMADALRSGARVLCILNRRGRARLLACNGCEELARCEGCGSAVGQDRDGELVCAACGTRRPAVCVGCGRTSLRAIRRGVSRLRDDLAAMVGEEVAEITGEGGSGVPTTRVMVGTTAALHQVTRCDVVVLCDFDQELFAPRYRAAEQAMALLVLAGRLVCAGAGTGGGADLGARPPRHHRSRARRPRGLRRGGTCTPVRAWVATGLGGSVGVGRGSAGLRGRTARRGRHRGAWPPRATLGGSRH
jgi:primosomal protein N' (replication factor Y)